MVWSPDQSGNPKGYSGPRNRRRHEVFDIIKNLGHKDALETLSYLQHNEQIEPGLRIAAAAALAPFCHPKMQATPTPRFIETPIEVPSEFSHVSDAEAFLANIALVVARGHLDIQSGLELSSLVKNWLDAQYSREELQFKINPPEERDTTIHITGGLPATPRHEHHDAGARRQADDQRPRTGASGSDCASDRIYSVGVGARNRAREAHLRYAVLAYDGNMVADSKLVIYESTRASR